MDLYSVITDYYKAQAENEDIAETPSAINSASGVVEGVGGGGELSVSGGNYTTSVQVVLGSSGILIGAGIYM